MHGKDSERSLGTRVDSGWSGYRAGRGLGLRPLFLGCASTSGADAATRLVLVAGATGYIGRHIVVALHNAGFRVRALVRNESKLAPVAHACDEIVVAEATDPGSLTGVCDGVDVVISALGLRSLRRSPTAEDVDFHANMNVLECARDAGVEQFIFIGVLNGDERMAHVPILRPREEFISELKQSGLIWSVIRPNGAFNDAWEIFRTAQRGWAIVLDDGRHRINFIHPADIAEVAVRSISDTSLHGTEYGIGGPDTYSHREITELIADILGKRLQTIRVPGWAVDLLGTVLRPFNGNASGFARFLRHTLSRDTIGDSVGHHRLADFYRTLAAKR